MTDLRISNGVAVITGAASGIGSGLARHAQGLGMALVLADQNERALEAFAASLDGDPLLVPCDVREPAALERLADATYARHDAVDLLFNNAGVMHAGHAWDMTPEIWRHSFAVNVDGVVNGIRAFAPRLIATKRPARIINTASIAGMLPSGVIAAYTATKFAVVGLTECVAAELAMLESPVTMALLAPGPVVSSILDQPADAKAAPYRDRLQELQDKYGISADDLAARAFEGILRGDYWLIPQPETLFPGLEAREASLRIRATPPLPVGQPKEDYNPQ